MEIAYLQLSNWIGQHATAMVQLDNILSILVMDIVNPTDIPTSFVVYTHSKNGHNIEFWSILIFVIQLMNN